MKEVLEFKWKVLGLGYNPPIFVLNESVKRVGWLADTGCSNLAMHSQAVEKLLLVPEQWEGKYRLTHGLQ